MPRFAVAIGLVVLLAPAVVVAERDSDRVWCATSTLERPPRAEAREPEPLPDFEVRGVASRPALGPSLRYALRGRLRSSRCGITADHELRVVATFVRGRARSTLVTDGDAGVQRCVAASLSALRFDEPGVVVVSFDVLAGD